MKRCFCILLMLLAVVPATRADSHETKDIQPSTQREKPKPTPKLVCREPVYDFGEMDNSQAVSHTFIIRNEGAVSLEIKKVKPACGCTVANISDKLVDPGAQTKISTRLSLRGRKGRQRKTITVFSNDPNNPRMVLQLEGTAVGSMKTEPQRVFFGQIGQDKLLTKTVDIEAQKKPIYVEKVESTTEAFSARLETIEEGQKYKIHVTTRPPLPIGRSKGHIRVSIKGKPDINIPVSASVVGVLAVAPQKIVLTQKGTQPVTRYVIIRPGKVETFKILSAEAPDDTMKIHISRMGSNGYRIQLSNIVPSDEIDGKALRIKTDAKGMEVISIPFQVLQRH